MLRSGADEPVRAILGDIEERVRFGADEDPPVALAQAVVVYLAHRLDEIDDDPDEIRRLAVRAEFDEMPPQAIAQSLELDRVSM